MNAVRLLLGALRRRGTARPRAGMGVALAAALLAGCTYRGTIDQPITIKLTWYSYLAGEDIRQTCVDSALPRYRLIYNGHYDEQIRSYEVVAKDDDGAHFTARVLGPMRAFAVIRDPLDLQDPWRWTVSEARLGPEGFAAFVSVLEDSGLWRPFGATMNLLSTEFYWVASGCRDGQFVFNAWRFGTPRYGALAFPELLLGYDDTGIALNRPRPVDPADRMFGTRPLARRSDIDSYVFVVRVGAGGLVGMGPRL
jgi:hypothetical protein